MILVTSANGNQGKRLIPKLLSRGHRVRAAVRSESSASELKAAGVHEVFVGDLTDASFVREAVRGVTSVYHVGPTLHPAERAIGFAMIDAARAEGISHFVFSSVLHAIITDLTQHEIKRDIEEHILASGLEFTILQPANYMLPMRLRPVFEHGVFRLTWSLDRRQSMIDLEDLTDVVEKVIADPAAHAAATYELVGPGRFTAHDIGAILSRVTGCPVAVEQIDTETFTRARLGNVSQDVFDQQVRMGKMIANRYSAHDFVGNPNVLTWLLSRPATGFEDFARREFAVYRT